MISRSYPYLKTSSPVVSLYSLSTTYYELVTKQLNLNQRTVYQRISTCKPDQINKSPTFSKCCIETIHYFQSKSMWYSLHTLRLNQKIYKPSLLPLTFKDIGPYLFFFPRQFYFRPCPEMRVLYLAFKQETDDWTWTSIHFYRDKFTAANNWKQGLPRPLQIVWSYLQHDFQNVLIIQACFTENIWANKTERSNI